MTLRIHGGLKGRRESGIWQWVFPYRTLQKLLQVHKSTPNCYTIDFKFKSGFFGASVTSGSDNSWLCSNIFLFWHLWGYLLFSLTHFHWPLASCLLQAGDLKFLVLSFIFHRDFIGSLTQLINNQCYYCGFSLRSQRNLWKNKGYCLEGLEITQHTWAHTVRLLRAGSGRPWGFHWGWGWRSYGGP